MSLRETYGGVSHAEKDSADPLTAPLATALAGIQHDLRFMAQAVELRSMTGVRRFFAGLKAGRPRGQRDTENDTLTYDLGSKTIEINESYWSAVRATADSLRDTWGAHVHGDDYVQANLNPRSEYNYEGRLSREAAAQAKALRERLLSQVRGLSTYRDVHAVCASPDVDMRVELVVDYNIGHKADVRNGGGGYSWDRYADKATTKLYIGLRLHINEPYQASSDASRMVPKKADVPPAPAV